MILLVDQEPVSEVVPLHDQPGGGHVNLVEDEGNKNNCHQQTENIIFITFVLVDNRETKAFDHEAYMYLLQFLVLFNFLFSNNPTSSTQELAPDDGHSSTMWKREKIYF